MAQFAEAQSYVIKSFKGIRQIDGLNGMDGQISATTAINVESHPIGDGQGYLLRTVLGNILVETIDDYSIIKTFETEQDGVKYLIAYAENENEGALYQLGVNGFELIVNGLSVTGQANGITMNDTAYDVFVFTNGMNFYSVCFAKNPIYELIQPIYGASLVAELDLQSNAVHGLAIAEQQGSLVIGSDIGVVIASRKGDITDWNYVTTADDLTKPWYQLVGKSITAVVSYIGGLMIFTKDDSRMFLGNMSDFNQAEVQSASLGGCFSYESCVLHDKYLFFYDNNQKNIYYYLQNDIGQKVLGEPVANNIQTFFKNPERVQMMSFVGNNKSEIWLKIDDVTLIYNYYLGEFYQRKQNKVNSYTVYDYEIYSCDGDGNLFKERPLNAKNCVFNGVYIPAVYELQYMDFGNSNFLKVLDERPLITYAKNYNNNFKITFNSIKKNKPKNITLYQSAAFMWANEEDTPESNPDAVWDVATFSVENTYFRGTVKGKAPNDFYVLKFKIETEEDNDDFSIIQIELRIDDIEKDTLGLK